METIAPYRRHRAAPSSDALWTAQFKPSIQQDIQQAVKMRAIDRRVRLRTMPKWVGEELQCSRCKGSFLGLSFRRCQCQVLSPFELQGIRV